MTVAATLLLAGSSDAPGAASELAGLAHALRADPSPENYQRLALFADQHSKTELGAQASFALGMADFEQERWDESSERFGAAGTSRRLGDYARLYGARAQAHRGALETAQHTLAEFSFAGSRLQEDAQALEADLLVRQGRAREAVVRLRRLPNRWNRPKLLLALAKALWAAGEPVAAAETLHHIYYEFPLNREAEPSNELSLRLRQELKSEYPWPSEALRRRRAERLWAQAAFRGARSAYLDLSVRAREPTRSEARLRAALALYQLGAASAACKELGTVARVPEALEGEFRSYRVRCNLLAGRTEQVEADLKFLESRVAGSEWFERALLAAGETARARGELARARDSYRRLVEAFPRSESTPGAHWKLAWLSYRAGESPAAARLMEEHLKRFPQSPFLPRALYWRAQLALEAGEEPLARRLLALVRERAPRDYLAQEAERIEQELQGAPAGNGDAFPEWLEELVPGARPALPELPPAVETRVEKAAALERLARWELAEEELVAVLRQFPHPEVYRAQARLAFVQEKYARATERLRLAYPDYDRYPLEELPRKVWEIIFPRPYWEVIRREARRRRVDPYLVAALIRQESRFERDARSSAGALGLMQLMPRTARSLARRRRLSESRILEPQFNIRLGTQFLAQLLRRFHGEVEKAVAGYNAGGTRVAEWVSQGGYRQPAEFVESIPVAQTRQFVYIVLRNYRFYRELYAPR
ncbi:MAG: transglycosylase SLT domain-containing protein [Terriglobia bacterium]